MNANTYALDSSFPQVIYIYFFFLSFFLFLSCILWGELLEKGMLMSMLECINLRRQSHVIKGLNTLGALYCGPLPNRDDNKVDLFEYSSLMRQI